VSRILAIDVGAGTLDVLYYDTRSGEHYKAVVQSPVVGIAREVEASAGKLLILGSEMGGGAVSRVLRERARTTEVVVSGSAAATVHHDLDRVRSAGLRVVDDGEARRLAESHAYTVLRFCDLEAERLERIVTGFGVPFCFDIVAVCAQDHGTAPAGVSQLDYRHECFRAALERRPAPEALLYRADEVPPEMSRLRSIVQGARALPTQEVYVMDSGMAAILGASLDPRATGKSKLLVIDIATSHTVGAALEAGELNGFFEYHTRDICLERLEELLRTLTDGKLEHARVVSEGGHGAYLRRAFGFDRTELILATGPKRKLVENSRLPIVLGAPLGDNMMTGTAGLLEALRRRKGLDPISYA
jgi:uncharacterized protein (DUF1786 family)